MTEGKGTEARHVETRGPAVEIGDIVGRIGETIQNEANVKAVFGQPIQLDSKTFVPVAVVSVSLGAGGGGARILGKLLEEKGGTAPFGGGGAMNVFAVPVGFLSEKEGAIVFTPIEIHDAHGDDVSHGLVGRLIHRVQQAAG